MQKILLTSVGFGTILDDEVLQMIDYAYEAVVAKLSKYIQSKIKELK